MAGITLAQAEIQLDAWLEASLKIASGQAYSIGGRSLTRANAAWIGKQIVFWNGMVQSLDRGGIKVRGGTPC